MDRLDPLKGAGERELERMQDTLTSLSRQIHRHPALGFEELQAVRCRAIS